VATRGAEAQRDPGVKDSGLEVVALRVAMMMTMVATAGPAEAGQAPAQEAGHHHHHQKDQEAKDHQDLQDLPGPRAQEDHQASQENPVAEHRVAELGVQACSADLWTSFLVIEIVSHASWSTGPGK
jgi:hypothetical protein